jgi:hypothetical protein
MSIEKLTDDSKLYRENTPYAQILNSITINIKDNDAYRLYCYLFSKSSTWNVAKEWTAKQCRVRERKAKQCWSYLERCGLIEYIVIRDEKGKILKHDVRVLNGTKFNPNEPFLKEKSAIGAETAPVDIHRCNYPPSGETTRMDIAPLLNKDLTNKDLKQKKDKSFCSSNNKKAENEDRHDFADNMDQMAREKQHIEENQIYKFSRMPDELRQLCKKLKIGSRK